MNELHGTADLHWPIRLLCDVERQYSRLEVTPELARAMVAHHGRDRQLLVSIARHEPTRRNPEIRTLLLESDAPEVLNEMAKDGRPEEFPILFRRLAPERPAVALDLVKTVPDAAREHLARGDLLRRVRLEAITLLDSLPEKPGVRRFVAGTAHSP